MNIFEAISLISKEKPYLQCASQKAFNIKIKPVDSNIEDCEVYLDGVLINAHYKIKMYELKQHWELVN